MFADLREASVALIDAQIVAGEGRPTWLGTYRTFVMDFLDGSSRDFPKDVRDALESFENRERLRVFLHQAGTATSNEEMHFLLGEAIRFVKQAAKETWTQMIEARAEARVRARVMRDTLIMVLRDAFGELP